MHIHWSNQIISSAILIGVSTLTVNSSAKKTAVSIHQTRSQNSTAIEDFRADPFPSRCDCGIARRCSAPCKAAVHL